MKVPFDLCNIRRNVALKENYKTVYLITEGTNTEPNFLKNLLSNSNYFKERTDLKFTYVKRKGIDFGKNRLSQMVECAKEIMKKRNEYLKDSIFIIFFDLDIYLKNLIEVENIIKENPGIYFAYTNPAFELFLLLCKENGYKQNVEPHKSLIFENNRVENTKRRYVHKLLSNITNINSKSGDVSSFVNYLENAIEEEQNLSPYLDDADKELVSNVGMVLRCLKENTLDKISYFKVSDKV